MKYSFLCIAKKELVRFFSDKRLIFSVLIFPGLMIFMMYNILGDAFNTEEIPDDYRYTIGVYNCTEELEETINGYNIDIVKMSQDEIENYVHNHRLQDGIEAYLIIPNEFYDVIKSGKTMANIPELSIYFDSTNEYSYQAYLKIYKFFEEMERSMVDLYDINNDISAQYDFAQINGETENILGDILPMVLLMLSFAGCMGVSTEAIAGEKEQGTIATILTTPINRRDVAIGKVIALGIIAFLSVCISTLSVFVSLPSIMGTEYNIEQYDINVYVGLLLLMLTTILFIVVILVNISSLCNSTKEAHTAAIPFMILVLLLGMSTMFNNTYELENYLFLIPIYNTANSIKMILTEGMTIQCFITMISNLAYTFVGVMILGKLLEKEKIIFSD